jgi:hypothetical protein
LRRTGFQRQAWQVPAQITKYRVETDGIRLELYDHGSYLHAVIPTPDCLSVVTRARKDIATTFNLFASECGTAKTGNRSDVVYYAARFRSQRRSLRRAGTAASYIP